MNKNIKIIIESVVTFYVNLVIIKLIVMILFKFEIKLSRYIQGLINIYFI